MAMIPIFQEKMVKTQQQVGGLDPIQRQNPLGKIPETLRPAAGVTNLPLEGSCSNLRLGEQTQPKEESC